jgi:predicted nucleotidyltransferase
VKSSLKAIYDRTVEAYRKDQRVVAAWEYGSAGKGTEDEHSDVDPVFVVRDADYQAVHDELRPFFEGVSSRLTLFWPEGFNAADIANYAVLFEPKGRPGEMLQYDMTVASVSSVKSGFGKVLLTRCGGIEVLFDKEGLLAEVLRGAEPDRYTPDKLLWDIERWWVYVYIHTKYLVRHDTFKLLYAQQTLREIHFGVLRALYPDAYWAWWPWTAKNVLTPEEQAHVMRYFGPGDAEAVATALGPEMAEFGADARRACAAWKLEYPAELERRIASWLRQEVPGVPRE